jgi:hypothetical protein
VVAIRAQPFTRLLGSMRMFVIHIWCSKTVR